MRTEELLALGLFDRGSRVRERIEMLLARGREFSPRASMLRVSISALAMLGLVIAGSFAPHWIAFAQRLEFEVASVKPQPWTGQGGVLVKVTGNTLLAEHMDLNGLVQFAYDLRDEQLSGGPEWTRHGRLDLSDLYQVIAKAAGDPPPATGQFRQMLQTLLADRFKLKIHHVNKDLPIYNLVIGKSGPKLKASAANTKFSSTQRPLPENSRFGIQMTVAHETIQQFVDQTGLYTGRPVFDKTGLTATYDFEIEFVPERAIVAAGLDAGGPSLFAAVQERLGLKLEPAVAAFDTVVIDHVEKPDEN
jgi:uncharacterized protein (TIGR03435 family)